MNNCNICLSQVKQPTKSFNWKCGHSYHKKCSASHIRAILSENLIDNLKCPECDSSLSLQEIKDANLKIADKYFNGQAWFTGLSGFIHCSYENCLEGKFLLPNEHECRVCHKKACRFCLGTVDPQHKCTRRKIDIFKNCPKCDQPIVKTGGCSHVICTNCKANFDWKSLSLDEDKWNPPPTQTAMVIRIVNPLGVEVEQEVRFCTNPECHLLCFNTVNLCCICERDNNISNIQMCVLCSVR